MSAHRASPAEPDFRRRLLGIAYRLLGSISEAEDAVQEGYARWYGLSSDERARIETPAAWLTTVIGRICLDMLKSARVRRESYSGPWLPEPVPGESVFGVGTVPEAIIDPLERLTREDSVRMAVMVLLERLTPAQRVCLVLHDVFDFGFAELANITGKTPGACRELASQGRKKVHDRSRATATREDIARSVAAFKVAWETGDVSGLVAQLSRAAVATIDGGGKVSAASCPLTDAEDIARFFLTVYEHQPDLKLREATVNGSPGIVALDGGGKVLATVSIDLERSQISRLWVTRNPEKLRAWG